MSGLGIALYLASCVIFFYFLIKNRKKVWGYINQEDLFFSMFGSLIWPVVMFALIGKKLFDWLEWVVND